MHVKHHAAVGYIPTVDTPVLKRLLDLTLAGLMLLCSAPVWLVIAIAIKLEDGGPVFYHQKRWGCRGSIFHVRKFRTMIQNAGLRPAEQHDRRVTRVGQILRACGMDELPQLLNIWQGEMSFVGPRALAVGELVHDGNGNHVSYETVPGFWERLAVPPGLTSIATIYIPKDSLPRRKFRYDMLYIRRQSVVTDLRLIALSFWISFRGKWETRDRKF
jgi:lipopolysaccharide/colanic/teichoic acid biosynthesis glycosyltransferase